MLEDIEDIVDSQSQTDPSFKTRRLYTRMSAAEVRQQLIEQKGYTDEELPSRQTIDTRLRELGYYPKRVAKSKPKKKIPETDAIFEHLAEVNPDADEAPDTQITRLLKRLRVHGIIKKVGRRYKYYLTEFGRQVALMALKLREMVIIPRLAHGLEAQA